MNDSIKGMEILFQVTPGIFFSHKNAPFKDIMMNHSFFDGKKHTKYVIFNVLTRYVRSGSIFNTPYLMNKDGRVFHFGIGLSIINSLYNEIFFD